MKIFKENKAFTLIELVMVILILGILAAAALPKFADLSDSAESAAMNGVAGAVRAGIGIVRAENLINNTTANVLTGGWPQYLDSDNAYGTRTATSATPLFDNVLDQGGMSEDWSRATGGTVTGVTATGLATYTYVPNDSDFVYFDDGSFRQGNQ